MYIPAHFRLRGREDALALMRAYPFATVISSRDGTPVISYLPCVIDERDGALEILAHFARANSHWQYVESAGATLLFHGPHGYVSPRWYVDPPHNVPTWNYSVVHATTTARLEDEAGTRAIVARLAQVFERGANAPWSIEGADNTYIANQLRGIVGVRFSVTALDAKFKLSQNRDAADRDGAIAGLRSTGKQSDADLAADMDHMSKPPFTV